MAAPNTARALGVIVDIARERCEQTGHECDWECALLDRSIVIVTQALADRSQGQAEQSL